MSQQGVYVPKNAYFGANMVGLGLNTYLFWEGAKLLDPLYQKTQCWHCFLVGHGTTWTRMVNIWPKNWAKNPNFYGRQQMFWYPHNGKPPRHFVRIVFPFPRHGPFSGAHPEVWPFLGSGATKWQLPLILVQNQRNSCLTSTFQKY